MIFAPGLFAGKVILISGAGGGVGGGGAASVRSGATLALTDLDAARLGAVALPLNALPLPADLRRVDDCAAVVAETVETYGRLDGLVNCAGIWVEGESASATEADWDLCLDVTLKGCFFLAARAIPALIESRGAIVNIASDAGVVGNAGAAIYCAAKGGLVMASRALALELAPKGVRVNALCPRISCRPCCRGRPIALAGATRRPIWTGCSPITRKAPRRGSSRSTKSQPRWLSCCRPPQPPPRARQ
ncbi:SDR family NAD(P)-dependent oxidoreductase [Gemmobacter lanyuensis]